MLCERCGKNRAEVHLIRIVNGKRVREHWCRECAAKLMSFDDVFNSADISFSMESIMGLKDALNDFIMPILSSDEPGPSITCPHCGEDIDIKKLWAEFMGGAQEAAEQELINYSESGEAEDVNYEEEGSIPEYSEEAAGEPFEEEPDFDAISPEPTGESEDPKAKELAVLKKRLELLVRWEKYERAAQVRDKIIELEKSMEGI